MDAVCDFWPRLAQGDMRARGYETAAELFSQLKERTLWLVSQVLYGSLFSLLLSSSSLSLSFSSCFVEKVEADAAA